MQEKSEQQNQTAKPVKTKKAWSKNQKIATIIGAVVIFIIGLIAIIFTATSAPLQASNKLIENIQKGNANAAYSLMSKDVQNVVSYDDFKSAVDQIGPILQGTPKLENREAGVETGTSPTAKMVYRISGTDDVDYRFTVNLVEENKEWKVLNFESNKIK